VDRICERTRTFLSCRQALARVEAYFEVLRDEWFAPRFPRVRRARLICEPKQHNTPRHFAAATDDGRLVIVAPEFAELAEAHQVAILAHELGHNVDFNYEGLFGLSPDRRLVPGREGLRRTRDVREITADLIASEVLGRRIGYTGPCLLQEIGRGRERPIGLR
jgi:hypothetical protein